MELRDVRRSFPVPGSVFARSSRMANAVDGLSFGVKVGETLSLVGESGAGKTTAAKIVLALEAPTAGSAIFEGKDIRRFGKAETMRFRASVQAVFQDPWASLDPRMSVASSIGEPLRALRTYTTASEARQRVVELLGMVGLTEAHASRYPHELSGGQRQRVAIARALGPFPRLLVLDEPVSALDVSVRAQVLNLLKDVQRELGLAYLLISHDLANVEFLSDRVAVMYLGQIVEEGAGDEVFGSPLHPYTRALTSAVLSLRAGSRREEIVLRGEIPSPAHIPAGCRFHPRCPYAMPRCVEEAPENTNASATHVVRCHLYSQT